MTIDDPALAERAFTETHDRILHALVEQVHEMGLRLVALEAQLAEAEHPRDLAPPEVPPTEIDVTAPRSATADGAARPLDQATTKTRSSRPTGWQPARR